MIKALIWNSEIKSLNGSFKAAGGFICKGLRLLIPWFFILHPSGEPFMYPQATIFRGLGWDVEWLMTELF